MFWCYILQSLEDGRYYIGSTDKIMKRLEQHNKGLVRSTKFFIPWKMIYGEIFRTRREAICREKQIKSWKKRKAIENLISKNKIVNPRQILTGS